MLVLEIGDKPVIASEVHTERGVGDITHALIELPIPRKDPILGDRKVIEVAIGEVGRRRCDVEDVERLTLPEDLCGWLNSRSRFARIGLMSHIAAPFLAPGISNKQILEIYNAGRNKIRLTPGMKICHVVLQECRGTAKYAGAWKDQEL